MPGRDVMLLMEDSPTFARSRSLKAHKALPRRRALSGNSGPLLSNGTERRHLPPYDRTGPADQPAKTIESLRPLPLTPPPSSQDEKNQNSSIAEPVAKDVLPVETPQGNGLSTPIAQLSPPTPDTTPPIQTEVTIKSHRPTFPRYPSSRTDSFKTAREQFSSDDEDEAHVPLRPSMVAQSQLQVLSSTRLKDIGLGLGLESDNGEITPTASVPAVQQHGKEFGTFDGAWSPEEEVVSDPFVVSEPAAVKEMTNGRGNRDSQDFTAVPASLSAVAGTTGASPALLRGGSLRERIERRKNYSDEGSIERFAEQIQWPKEIIDFPIDGSMAEKRFSQASTVSTVVEVVVVATPPRRQQTLRHTYRNNSLRAASSPVSRSKESSLASEERKPRLVHRNQKIGERGNPVKLNSDCGIGMGSERVIGASEILPLAIIPRRHSSLKRSKGTVDRRSRALEPIPKHMWRPSTAPDTPNDSPTVGRQRHRTLSGSMVGLPRVPRQDKDVIIHGPVIPARSSSLSAPTSRNVSRTASLTSTTLHAHNAEIRPRGARHESPRDVYRVRPFSNDGQEKSIGDEWLNPQRRSVVLSPFSLISAQSSTPGAMEINTAEAINIYSHNNKSILVIEQSGRKGLSEADVSTMLVDRVNVTTPDPKQTPRIHRPIELVDSPMRNPREAPQPPNVKVIPPTPAARTPNDSDDQAARGRKRTRGMNGPISLVKRAFSAKRHSESHVSPLQRSLTARKTLKFPFVGDDRNNKLSPFWRPRGFWDDLSDSDEETKLGYFRPSHAPGQPSRAQKQPLSRRLGSLKLRRRSQSLDMGSMFSRTPANSYTQTFGITNQMQSAPRRRYSIHVPSFTGLQERFEKVRAKHEDERREKQRARLKDSIGPVVLRLDDRPMYY